MNDLTIAIIGVLVPIFIGLVAWIMNGLHGRVSSLENHQENLAKEKLDKADYYRDQGAMRETLNTMSTDIKSITSTISELPEKLVNLIVKLNGSN
jgi:hypothetical protein